MEIEEIISMKDTDIAILEGIIELLLQTIDPDRDAVTESARAMESDEKYALDSNRMKAEVEYINETQRIREEMFFKHIDVLRKKYNDVIIEKVVINCIKGKPKKQQNYIMDLFYTKIKLTDSYLSYLFGDFYNAIIEENIKKLKSLINSSLDVSNGESIKEIRRLINYFLDVYNISEDKREQIINAMEEEFNKFYKKQGQEQQGTPR